MTFVNYNKLKEEIIGTSIPKPISGTLSGHAAGEPFDKHVYNLIKKQLPENTFRQYEYLNDLFSKNPNSITLDQRLALFNSPSILSLLSRGKDATKKWSINNQFEEKQDDTADILISKDNFFEIIDIKTRNISKSAQPPNIISSYKLAQLCSKILDNKEYDILSINYFEIDWKLDHDKLICYDAHFISLFKTNPKGLYINWAAAMQIQFHVSNLSQDYEYSIENWCIDYLKHYVSCVYKRTQFMINKYTEPFDKYI